MPFYGKYKNKIFIFHSFLAMNNDKNAFQLPVKNDWLLTFESTGKHVVS